jgi:hypothetical protein
MPKLGSILLFLTISIPSHAGILYDLVADWSPEQNPNGAWSFYQGSTLMTFQTSLGPLGGVPGYAPGDVAGDFLPVVWKLGPDVDVHSVDIYNGSPALGDVSVRWTAQESGTIDLTGYMYYGQGTMNRSNDFLLSLGSDTLASGSVHYEGYALPPKYTYSFNGLKVTAGEVLSLTLWHTLGYTPGFEPGTITAMDWTITETPDVPGNVPEPATGILVMAGVAGTAWLRQRRHAAR